MKISPTEEYFEQLLLTEGILEFLNRPRPLQSGKKSIFYLSFRKFVSDMDLQDQLASYYMDMIEHEEKFPEPQSILGVPESMISLGERCQYLLNERTGLKHLSRLRRSSKSHGDPAEREFIGMPRGNTYLLEDTTTTGTSLANSIERILKKPEDDFKLSGCVIGCDRLGLDDWGRTAKERIQDEYHIPVKVISDITTLLPRALSMIEDCRESGWYAKMISNEYEKEYQRYGRISPLRGLL